MSNRFVPGEGAKADEVEALIRQVRARGLTAVLVTATAIGEGDHMAAVMCVLPNTETALGVRDLIMAKAAQVMEKPAVAM